MRYFRLLLIVLVLVLASSAVAGAGVGSTLVRETAEIIFKKFGKGAAGKTIGQITEATTRVVAKHGEAALPLLRSSGHAGFTALEKAGAKAPEVIKLFARRGNEAVWVISDPKKLAIFLKHGDSAAGALLKHPGIADNLIGRFGDDAVGALHALSRTSAQRLSMVTADGLVTASGRNRELLHVVAKYGDKAMDFIWKNKGALAVTAVLVTFLKDPQTYINGTKELIVEPVAKHIINPGVTHIVQSINWTLIILVVLAVVSLPLIVRSVAKTYAIVKRKKNAGSVRGEIL